MSPFYVSKTKKINPCLNLFLETSVQSFPDKKVNLFLRNDELN